MRWDWMREMEKIVKGGTGQWWGVKGPSARRAAPATAGGTDAQQELCAFVLVGVPCLSWTSRRKSGHQINTTVHRPLTAHISRALTASAHFRSPDPVSPSEGGAFPIYLSYSLYSPFSTYHTNTIQLLLLFVNLAAKGAGNGRGIEKRRSLMAWNKRLRMSLGWTLQFSHQCLRSKLLINPNAVCGERFAPSMMHGAAPVAEQSCLFSLMFEVQHASPPLPRPLQPLPPQVPHEACRRSR